MGQLRMMGQRGDTHLIWDPNRPSEVDAAREMFDKLSKGPVRYNAYKVTEGGGKGEMIREFDANAEKIIMAPPMAGG